MVDGPTITGYEQTPFVSRSLVVLRLACAGVLGFAAVAKLLSPAVTAEFLSDLTHLGPVVGWVLAMALIGVEATAAVLLLLPRYASKGGALAALLGLAALLYRVTVLDGTRECPCFGRFVRVDPTTGLLLVLTLLGAGSALALAGGLPVVEACRPRARRRRRMPSYAGASLAVSLLVTVGAVLRTAEAKRGSIAPLTAAARAGLTLGQAVPDTHIIAGGQPLALSAAVGDQPTTVSFLSLECAACRVYVRSLADVLREVPQARAVLVVPHARQLDDLEQQIGGSGQCTMAVRGDGETRAMLPNPTHLLVHERRLARVTASTSEVAAWLRLGAERDPMDDGKP